MRSFGYARVVPLSEGFAALAHMGFKVSAASTDTAPRNSRTVGDSIPMGCRCSGAEAEASASTPSLGSARTLLAWATNGSSGAAATDGASATDVAGRVAAAQASLSTELSPEHVDIRAQGGDAFEAVVVAERFADLPLLERHRLVLSIVVPHLGDAVSVKAKTPKQWARVASS